MNKTWIIAEAGVNHNGSFQRACELIDAACAAGADAVKFQTFKADALVTRTAQKAAYQKRNTAQEESQYAMLKSLELSHDEYIALKTYAQKKGITFLSTPFDEASLDFLVDELGLNQLKLSSGDLTNAPLLLSAAQRQLPLILSTGMATLAEIEQALSVVAYGYLATPESKPSIKGFWDAYLSHEGQRLLQARLSLLHCTTEYPAPMKDVHLRAMLSMQQCFGLPVGYSDHTEGIHIPVAAVSLGAHIIEKHFTLDKSLPGPDHKASLEPEELKKMVTQIRDIECALGQPVKRPSETELANRAIARKSLVTAKAVQKGEPFTLDNLTTKRPETGEAPIRYWQFLGKTAEKNYQADEVIES